MKASSRPSPSRSPTVGLRRLASKRWLVSIATYGLTNAFSKSISGVITIVYAYRLSPSQMGVLGLMLGLAAFADVISNFGITRSIVRAFYDIKNGRDARLQFLARSILFARVLGFSLMAPLSIAAAFWWSRVVGTAYPWWIYVPLMSIYAYATRSNWVFDTLSRVLERPQEFAFNRFLQSIILLLTSGILVFWLNLGLLGAIGSMAVSTATAAIVRATRFSKLVPKGSVLYDRSEAVALIRYGLPLVPRELADWGRLSAVRIVIAIHLAVAQVGFFFLASSVVSVLTLATDTIEMWLNPEYMKLRSRGDDASYRTLRLIRQGILASTTPVYAAAALLLPDLMPFVLPPRYAHAAGIVPGLLLVGFVQLQSQFQTRQLLYLKKTSEISFVASVSLGLNLALTYGAAALFGLPAVVLATVVATFVGLVMTRRITARFEPSDVGGAQIYGSTTLVASAAALEAALAGVRNPALHYGIKAAFLVVVLGAALLVLLRIRRERTPVRDPELSRNPMMID